MLGLQTRIYSTVSHIRETVCHTARSRRPDKQNLQGPTSLSFAETRIALMRNHISFLSFFFSPGLWARGVPLPPNHISILLACLRNVWEGPHRTHPLRSRATPLSESPLHLACFLACMGYGDRAQVCDGPSSRPLSGMENKRSPRCCLLPSQKDTPLKTVTVRYHLGPIEVVRKSPNSFYGEGNLATCTTNTATLKGDVCCLCL